MNERYHASFDSQLVNHIINGRNDEAKSMIKQEMVRAYNDYGTLLHYAASYKNDIMASYLIEMGSEIEAIGHYGRTPLMNAVNLGNRATVKLLLDAGANMNVTGSDGKNVLQMAFERRFYTHSNKVHLSIYEKLQSQAVNVEDLMAKLSKAGCTLYHAVHFRDFDLMECMLKNGMDVDSRGINEMTAVHAAVELDDLELAKWIIAKGANVNIRDRDGFTALLLAAMKVNKTLIQLLLEHGADPNIGTDGAEEVPLFTLVMNEKGSEDALECMELLMQHGAIPKNIVDFSSTIFDYALDSGNFVSAHYLVAQLALLEKTGKSVVESVMHCNAEEYQEKMKKLAEYYELCEKILGCAMFRNFSLFDLLTRERIVRRCVRNRTFAVKIEKICLELELRKSYTYYFNTLMKRINKATKLIELEDIGIQIVCDLLNACGDECDIAARRIVGYLDECELGQLVNVL